MGLKGVLIVLVLSTIFLTACNKADPGLQTFAQCMTEAGATMYGTEWCPHCKDQKEMFGDAFSLIHYVDCDKFGVECQNAGVTGFPTWSINGENYPGTQSLERLGSLTGCEIQ